MKSSKHRFGERCSVKFISPDEFIIEIRSSWKKLLSLPVIGGILFSILTYFETDTSHLHNYIYGAFALYCILIIFVRTTIYFNSKECKLSKVKNFIGVKFPGTDIEWLHGGDYIYEIEYGSYQSIEAIWVVSRSKELHQRKYLFCFANKDTYDDFIAIVRTKLPEFKIGEWHD